MEGAIGLRAGSIQEEQAVGPEELADTEGIPREGRTGLLAKDAGHLGALDQLEGWLLGELDGEEVREFRRDAGRWNDGNAEWGSGLGVEESGEEEDDPEHQPAEVVQQVEAGGRNTGFRMMAIHGLGQRVHHPVWVTEASSGEPGGCAGSLRHRGSRRTVVGTGA